MTEAINVETSLPIPNGWFAVAFSKDLEAGGVQRLRMFGQDLVLFRTREGVAKILDAYCPHLGSHLGEGGRVVGETIRCPFHWWQCDGDGQCVKIPYSKTGKIPPKAKVRSWDVAERNMMIFAWHHAEQKPPCWEVPAVPQLGQPDWTEPHFMTLEVGVHLQDMAENNCDPVHFLYVHSADVVPDSINTFAEDGRFYRAVSEGERVTEFGTFNVTLTRDTWGMGMSSVELSGIPNAGLYMFSSTSPVEVDKSISRWIFTVSKNMVDAAGDDFIHSMSQGVLEDMRIWENKIHRPNPVLCDADTFLAEFRQWTKQFYSNAD
jgi:phenylpropionate dioxygenase-like ring-hydroxylating dioxygenase large terminal subunit